MMEGERDCLQTPTADDLLHPLLLPFRLPSSLLPRNWHMMMTHSMYIFGSGVMYIPLYLDLRLPARCLTYDKSSLEWLTPSGTGGLSLLWSTCPRWYIVSPLKGYLFFTADKSYFQSLRISFTFAINLSISLPLQVIPVAWYAYPPVPNCCPHCPSIGASRWRCAQVDNCWNIFAYPATQPRTGFDKVPLLLSLLLFLVMAALFLMTALLHSPYLNELGFVSICSCV